MISGRDSNPASGLATRAEVEPDASSGLTFEKSAFIQFVNKQA
jgi:hypothetical protein